MKPGRAEFVALSRLAVVGVSRTKGFANLAFRHLKQSGYTVFPVNAGADEVEGERCYRRLDDLPEPVEGVVIVVPPAAAAEVVADCARLGITRVWLQQGAESPEALARCEAAGITAVHRACIMMYANPRGFHRFHRGVMRLFGQL
jgi:predicted CoA-binding protein